MGRPRKPLQNRAKHPSAGASAEVAAHITEALGPGAIDQIRNLHPSLGTATHQYAATSVELEVVEHASWESSASD